MRPLVQAERRTFTARNQALTGKVTWVSDGDTVKMGRRTIRLAEIDAPESKQPYGQTAKQVLFDMVQSRDVRIVPVTTDRHGRTVAHIYRDDGLHVNAAMVEAGAAHVYRRYSHDPHLIPLEEAARRGSKGLWGLPADQRIPPEQWRRDHKGAFAVTVPRPASTASGAFDCAVRKTCSRMKSCEEAEFYLNECGVKRLDRDGDGVPCERICKPR